MSTLSSVPACLAGLQAPRDSRTAPTAVVVEPGDQADQEPSDEGGEHVSFRGLAAAMDQQREIWIDRPRINLVKTHACCCAEIFNIPDDRHLPAHAEAIEAGPLREVVMQPLAPAGFLVEVGLQAEAGQGGRAGLQAAPASAARRRRPGSGVERVLPSRLPLSRSPCCDRAPRYSRASAPVDRPPRRGSSASVTTRQERPQVLQPRSCGDPPGATAGAPQRGQFGTSTVVVRSGISMRSPACWGRLYYLGLREQRRRIYRPASRRRLPPR